MAYSEKSNRKERTAEELADILDSLCMGEDSIPQSCTGKVNDPEKFRIFDYRTHHFLLKKKLEFQKYLSVKKILFAKKEVRLNLDDSAPLAEITEHYGPWDTNSPIFKRYFEIYKKLRLDALHRWENMGAQLKFEGKLRLYDVDQKIDMITKTIEKYLSDNKSFHDQSSLNLGNDFYKLPRLNYMQKSTKIIKFGSKFLVPKRNREKLSKNEVLQLKEVIKEFPLGICISKFRNRLRNLYCNNSLVEVINERDFIIFCEELTEVFFIPEKDRDLDLILLFPAVLTGLLQPIHYILQQLWHWVKFILNTNSNGYEYCIFIEEIIPELKNIFGIDFIPGNWGFDDEQSFIRFLCLKKSSEGGYSVCYNGSKEKYILTYDNDSRDNSILKSFLEVHF